MTTAIITIERDEAEIEVEVEGTIIPGEPMVAYYSDGSGYPGSGPEVDDIRVVSPAGLVLTDEEQEKAEEALLSNAAEDYDGGPEYEPDYDLYDCEYDR